MRTRTLAALLPAAPIAVVLSLSLVSSTAADPYCQDYEQASRIVGRGPFATLANVSNLVQRNGYRYVGGPNGITIYDVGDPANPIQVGTMPGAFHSLQIADDFLAAGRENEVEFYDRSVPAAPTLVTSRPIAIGNITRMTLEQNVSPGVHRLFGWGDAGATFLTLFDANTMADLGTSTETGPASGVNSVRSHQTTGLVTEDGQVWEYTFSGSAFQSTGTTSIPGMTDADMFSADSIGVVGSFGFQTWDFSQAPPVQTGANGLGPQKRILADRQQSRWYVFDVDEDMTHVVDANGDVSASMRMAPANFGLIDVLAASIDGEYMIALGRNAGAAFPVQHRVGTGRPDAVAMLPDATVDDVQYRGDFLSVSGDIDTKYYHVSDPQTLVPATTIPTPDAVGVALLADTNGTHHVVVGSSTQGTKVFDADGNLVASDPDPVNTLSASRDIDRIATGDASGNVRLFDLIGSNLTPRATFTLTSPAGDVQMSIDGSRLVVATETGTREYDVSDPDNPTLTRTFPGTGVRCLVEGTHEKRRGGVGRVWFLSTFTATFAWDDGPAPNGAILGSLPNAGCVALSHPDLPPGSPELLYGVDGLGTMQIMDWSDPTSPVDVGEYTAPGLRLVSVAAGPDVVFLADTGGTGQLLVVPAHGTPAANDATLSDPATIASRLEPAWPNPFTAQTRIPLALPRTTSVELSVYDVTGRLVRTLARDTLRDGRHVLAWDGRDAGGRSVATGVYFVRLTTPERTERAKIVRVR